MPSLTFAALLPKDQDTTMEDAPPLCIELPIIEVTPPIDFDFDFELDELSVHSGSDIELQSDSDDLELRSPRTPTFTGSHSDNIEPVPPFDADRYFSFPLLESSPAPSPLAVLSHSFAAKSHYDIHLPFTDTQSNHEFDPSSPPKSPLLWIWTCHLCRSRYPLGATRRCLIDGHYYCSGDANNTVVQRNVKKKKRGQACSSEFDYVGWQEWGSWKRKMTELRRQCDTNEVKTPSSLKGCQACDYPSECRYRRMNKIPDVVLSATRKFDCEVEAPRKTKEESSTDAKKLDTKVEKKKILKVDTGTTSVRRRKIKGRQGSMSDTATGASASAPASTCRIKVEIDPAHSTDENNNDANRSPSSLSPDLVDFSALVATPEHQLTQVQSSGKHGEKKGFPELPGSTALASTTRQAKSEIPVGERHTSRQSRISDFFSIKG